MLLLQEKIVRNQKEAYKFIKDGDVIVKDYNTSMKLIQSCFPSERNCRVINGTISLKQGELPINSTPTTTAPIVRIYTRKSEAPNIPYIESNDLTFSRIEQNAAFLKKHKEIIKALDGATIVNPTAGKIETPYGVTDIGSLSTGLKTLLNILYCLEHTAQPYLININECGENVLKYVFPVVAGTNIALFVEHMIFYIPEGYTYVVNGKTMKDRLDMMPYLENMEDRLSTTPTDRSGSLKK